MNFFKKSKNQFVVSEVIVLAMVFGFVAGLVGQLVADAYFDPWYDDYLSQSLLTNANQDLAPVIPELRPVKTFLGIEQDFEVNKTVKKLEPSLAGIYFKKAANADKLNQIYLPQELQANAFVLTNDGWLLSYGKLFSETKKERLAVVYRGKAYDLEKVVVDPTTKVVFVKINATGLPVVTLGDSSELINGQLNLILNFDQAVVVSNFKDVRYRLINTGSDLLQSTEEYTSFLLLADSLDNDQLGSPVVNLGGEVVGLVKETVKGELTTAVPINQLRSVMINVLRNEVIKRPALGLEYLDLTQASGLNQSISQGLNRGALIYQAPKKGTSAQKANLQVGDVILSVDQKQVDQDSSLTELIQDYRPADEVILEVSRQGKTFDQTVILGALE